RGADRRGECPLLDRAAARRRVRCADAAHGRLMSETSVEDARRDVARARRIVIKIGSRTLAGDRKVYERLARAIAGARAEGRSVVLVSSGAIALGVQKLGFGTHPKEMAKL